MGFGGNRFEFWSIFSGVIVNLPCLKTYFAIAEAKMAGWTDGDEVVASSLEVTPLSSRVALGLFATALGFSFLLVRHGRRLLRGLTLPFFTKWLITYSHLRSQHNIRLQISNP